MDREVMRNAFAGGGNMVNLSPLANIPFDGFYELFRGATNMTHEAFAEIVQRDHIDGYDKFFASFPWEKHQQ